MTTIEELFIGIHKLYPKISADNISYIIDNISSDLLNEDKNVYIKAKLAVRSWIRHKFTRYDIEWRILGKRLARKRNYDKVMTLDKYFAGVFNDPLVVKDLEKKYRLER